MENEGREQYMASVAGLFIARRQNTLATIRAIGERYRTLQDTFPKRAKKGEGFIAFVDAYAAKLRKEDRHGIGSRQARTYIKALAILEANSTMDFTGWSVSKIARYKAPGAQ